MADDSVVIGEPYVSRVMLDTICPMLLFFGDEGSLNVDLDSSGRCYGFLENRGSSLHLARLLAAVAGIDHQEATAPRPIDGKKQELSYSGSYHAFETRYVRLLMVTFPELLVECDVQVERRSCLDGPGYLTDRLTTWTLGSLW